MIRAFLLSSVVILCRLANSENTAPGYKSGLQKHNRFTIPRRSPFQQPDARSVKARLNLFSELDRGIYTPTIPDAETLR